MEKTRLRTVVMTYKIIVLTIFCFITIITGCNNYVNPESSQYFPVQEEKADIVLQALLQGTLTRDDNGYLRVYTDLIIWPYGYSCAEENGQTWIIDDEGTKIFKVGDFVKIGGGELSKRQIEGRIGQLLPTDCEGPYWLTGQIVK